VSARNSRGAKAARRNERARHAAVGTLPGWSAPVTQAEIAGAVHDAVTEAVTQTTGLPGSQLCALYAWAGAMVATVATGALYGFQAGGVCVVNALGEGLYVLGPGWGPVDGEHDFHAWFSPVLTAADADELWKMPPWLEIADLSMRHFQPQAARAGLTWNRGPLPAWCWDKRTTIRDSLRVTYRPHRETTLRIHEEIARNSTWWEVGDYVATAAAEKLELLSDGFRSIRRRAS
jgi:hypothetical protein